MRALRGEPFALIGLLWPNLLVTDMEDARWLQGQPKVSENDVEQTWLDPCLRLDYWQRDGIASVFMPGYRQVMTKGCTKAGKGAWTSLAICLWWYLFDPCKILIVGPNFEHVKSKSMLPEVKRFLRQMTDQRQTVINAESINWPRSEDKFIAVGNADTAEGFSGIHGRNTLVVFDESSDIRDDLFQQSKTFARMIIALSNPRSHSGWFRESFGPPALDPDLTQTIDIASGKRRLITVSGLDCVNVKAEREIIPGQVTKEVLAEVMDPKGKASWWPRCMGEGKFPVEDAEKMLFLPTWLEAAEAYHRKLTAEGHQWKPRAFGLDVGASRDGDPSCLAVAAMNGIVDLHLPESTGDTIKLVQWVLSFVKTRYSIDLTKGTHPVEVDVIGVGKGAFDALAARGVKVLQSIDRRKSKRFRENYLNARTERYGELSARLDLEGEYAENPFALPFDQKLREELIAHEKFYDSEGKFRITPKRKKPGQKSNFQGPTIFDKLGRSPDRADAVAMAFSALRSMIRSQSPRVNRDLNFGTSHDYEKAKQPLPKIEDLPPMQVCNRDVEPIQSVVARVVAEMDANDDWRRW